MANHNCILVTSDRRKIDENQASKHCSVDKCLPLSCAEYKRVVSKNLISCFEMNAIESFSYLQEAQ